MLGRGGRRRPLLAAAVVGGVAAAVEQGVIDPESAAEAQQAVNDLNERYHVIAAEQQK